MKKLLIILSATFILIGCAKRPYDSLEEYIVYPINPENADRGITFNKLIENTITTEKSPLIEKGKELIKKGKPQLAAATFNQVLKKNPNDLHAKLGMGLVPLSQGKINDAIPVFQDIVASDPSSAVGLAYSGWLLSLNNKPFESEKYLSTFRALYPDNAVTHFLDAWSYRKKTDFAESEKSYKLAIIAEPRFRDAYFDYATLLKEEQKDNESVKVFVATTELSPDYIDAYREAGDIYIKLGKYDQAINQYKKVVANSPTDQKAQLGLCIAYAKSSNFQLAIDTCKKVSAKETLAMYYLAEASQNINKKTEAISSYKKFITAETKRDKKSALIPVAEKELTSLSKAKKK